LPGPTLATSRTIRLASILDGFIAILEADPGLAEIGATVLTQDGSRRNLPQFRPESAQLPSVKVLEPGLSGRWIEEGGHEYALTIPVELTFRGSHYRDHATFIELFSEAVLPPHGSETYEDVHANWIENEDNRIRGVRIAAPAIETVHLGTDQFATCLKVNVMVTYDQES
jgi:hypothetical protein